MLRAEPVPVGIGECRRTRQHLGRRGLQGDIQQRPGQIVQRTADHLRVLGHLTGLLQRGQELDRLRIRPHLEREGIDHVAGRLGYPRGFEGVQQRAYLTRGGRVVEPGEGDLLIAAVVTADVDRRLRPGRGQHSHRQIQQAHRPAEVRDGVHLEGAPDRAQARDEQELSRLEGRLDVERDLRAVQPDDPALRPLMQPLNDDRVVDDVGKPAGGDAHVAGRTDGGDPLRGALGGRVHVGRVGPQGLSGRRAHHLRHADVGRYGQYVARAEDICGHRAVHFNFGQAGVALSGNVEHNVGPDGADRLVQALAVPDVRLQVLRARDPWPRAGDPAAHTDQAAGSQAAQLSHESRADAAGAAGHQDDRPLQPFGEQSLRQAQGPLSYRPEPLVLLTRTPLGGNERSGQTLQFPYRVVAEVLLPRRRGRPHHLDDLPLRLHPPTPPLDRGARFARSRTARYEMPSPVPDN